MKRALTIFRFLIDAAQRGERTVLVTLTDVVGSSSRALGTHIAVSETGDFVGSLSGGCVEAAVVGEALQILSRGRAELIRFGAGSRFIDIRLPCGGGIDLLFTPDPRPELIRQAAARLSQREPVGLLLDRDGGIALHADCGTGWRDSGFVASHEPDLRVLVIGHGAEPVAMARLASAYGADVEVLSPDAALVESLGAQGIAARVLVTPRSTSLVEADAFTAIVFLFHDHDWEPALMAAALATPAFFIGAMGSRATHAQRREMLVQTGVDPVQIDRIAGPIGLIPATRDPDTLALSVLAQIAAAATGRSSRLPPASSSPVEIDALVEPAAPLLQICEHA